MINEVFKLTEPKKLEICFREEDIEQEDYVVVKPTYMSICAADQRYYQGKRKKEILDKKLPLTLIHEAIGKVLLDPKGEYEKSESVVLIPNTPNEEDEIVKENYRKTSTFRSSSQDGFMQNLVFMRRDRIIPIGNIKPEVASLLELTSVSMNAIKNFSRVAHKRKEILGVWGPGSLGYITGLILKMYFSDSKIIVFGTNIEKLNCFSFVDETLLVNNVDKNFKVDHAFECVGGRNSEIAIEQIIDCINPQGTINLLGVSEEPIHINTRMVLEKGITLLGNSRSGYEDFQKATDFMQDEKVQSYMENIISDVIEVDNIKDIGTAFDIDYNNNFKTIMRWNI